MVEVIDPPSGTDATKYQDFLDRHRRDLNCLLEKDRNIRMPALTRLKKELSAQPASVIEPFYRTDLLKPLVIILEDPIEKCREIAIEMFTEFVETYGLKEEAQLLLPAIVKRMNSHPFPETSEEVRI